MGAYLAKWEPIWEPISRNAHLGKWDYFPNGHFVSLRHFELSDEGLLVFRCVLAFRSISNDGECSRRRGSREARLLRDWMHTPRRVQHDQETARLREGALRATD